MVDIPAHKADEDTHPERRRNIIETLSRELDPTRPESATSRLRDFITAHRGDDDVRLLVSGDIDGIVSAMMLFQATGWQACALVVGSEKVYFHPDFADVPALLDGTVFGVDVFSLRFPNASNHPVFWGNKEFQKVPKRRGQALMKAFDDAVLDRVENGLVINPSAWARIEGARGEKSQGKTVFPRANPYRYPLGTAQALLATLERAGFAPRMFDREYLPWLVANCDGGLKSIGRFPFNVPTWWSALAAAVGPASLSESLYQLASNQRPNQFRDVRNQLRAESPAVAEILEPEWNIASPDPETIAPVVKWIEDISGWPDPFRGGVESLDQWPMIKPNADYLKLYGTPTLGSRKPAEAFEEHLRLARRAIHLSFYQYRERAIMGYMLDS